MSKAKSKVKKSLKGNRKTKSFIPNLLTTPSFICFKDYEEGKVYKENIQILNKDLKSYHLAIKFDNPNEVKLSIVGNVSKTRIDSGEDILLEVEFLPTSSFRKESVDRRYEICLKIVNANTKFIIPVIILSLNPVVNFPKEISFPDTAVNTPAFSNIFVLNCSKQICKFAFESRSDIKIVPHCKIVSLKPGDGSTFLIEFTPKVIENFREKIHVCFDTDKKISILLKCNVIPVNIFLNEENIKFPPTFIGMTESKEIHIVNNSDDTSFFEWISNGKLHNDKNDSVSEKYFQIVPIKGELQPNSITTINVTFKPEDTDNDEDEILKEVFFTFALQLSLEVEYNPLINIRGKIVGPSFQLNRKTIDLGSLYLGESRMFDLIVVNSGVIEGTITFQKSPTAFDGIVKVSTKTEKLSPGETKTFKFKYLARRSGKFIEQAFFKVKNGEKLSFIIEGVIKPLEVIVEPKFADFSNSPICMPRMQLLLISNHLPFDVVVKVDIEKTGTDDPLEFLEFYSKNVQEDETETSNSTMSTSSWKSEETQSCLSILSRFSIKNFFEKTEKLEHLRESIKIAEDGIKTIYNRVEEYLESTEIVQNIIQHVFDGKVKDELEKNFIVETIVDLLVESIKETEMQSFVEFKRKDWKFPENPREVDVNRTSIELPANTTSSASIKVFLTPNFIGKYRKNLKLRVSLSNQDSCPKQSIEETVINVPIVIDCQPAELIIHNQINNVIGFAESEIPLDILVENSSDVHGFFAVTRLDDSEMIVKCDEEKFYIASKAKKLINLIVIPLKSGLILKHINLVVLGSNRKFPLSIECKSLPPDIIVKPCKIFEGDLRVLTIDNTRIFIENRSTSKARFNVKLEYENEVFELSPKGGILSSKQSVLVTLKKYFYDPGEYKNILVLKIVNGRTIKIPIKCFVRNLPIIFEPSINKEVDFGTLFVSKTPYFLEHVFTNGGRNTYMIFIISKNWKNKNETRYLVEPNRFELKPNQSKSVKFYLNAENVSVDEEAFTIEGCSTSFPVREIIRHSVLKANIVRPALCFSQTEVSFKCVYEGNFNDQTKSIEITNKSDLPLTIALKVQGEFFIANRELNRNELKVKFDLMPDEAREIFIGVDKNIISAKGASEIYGKIKAFSLGKLQQTIELQAKIVYPTIETSSNVLTIVNNMLTKVFSFTIKNNGEIDSKFNLRFAEASTIITKIQERKQTSLMNITQLLMKQKCNLKKTFFEPSSEEREIKLAFSQSEDENVIDENELNDPHDVEFENKIEETKLKSRQKVKRASRKKAKNLISVEAQEYLQNNIELEVTLSDVQKYFKQLMKHLSEVVHNRGIKVAKNSSVELNEPSSLKESASKYLKLSQTQGSLKPGEGRLISILFIGSSEAFHLSTVIELEVQGGFTQNIAINFTNCNPNLLVSKTFFEIPNHHQWDEILINNIFLSNLSPACNQIKLITDQTCDERQQIINGYVKLSKTTDLCFTLDEQRNFCYNLKFSTFLGCAGIFRSEFGIQVNDKPPIPISFVAKNRMQTATLINVEHQALYDIDKIFEYECLRKLSKYVDKIRLSDEVVKFEDILKIKAQLKMEQEILQSLEAKARRKSVKKDKMKNAEKVSAEKIFEYASGDCESIQDYQLFYDSKGIVKWREKKNQPYSAKVLQMIDECLDEEGFQVLDYPEEYPEAVEVINFIEQEGLAESLTNDDVFKEFKDVYNRHVLEKFKRSKPSNSAVQTGTHLEAIVLSSVVPLPLILQPYEINLGSIGLNESSEKVVQFYYHGSSLAASLRAEAFVHGLSMKFLQNSEAGNFLKIIDFDVTSKENCGFYQNRFQREKVGDVFVHPTVKRCHSFDFTSSRVHSRKIPTTAAERNEIIRTYNELISTKPKEKPKTFVHSEIYQNSLSNEDSRILQFKLTLHPSNDYFEDNTEFDEIVYLDIHLGPQIPINLKAKLVQQTCDDPVQDVQSLIN